MARILIAEDDPHIARVIALWLKRNGHEVMATDTGDKALAAMRANTPDLLVTDVNMPGMSGLQLLEAARAESLLRCKAIVLTSRCDQAEIAADSDKLGAIVHPKPFSPRQLTETIEIALKTTLDTTDTELAESMAVEGDLKSG